MNMTVDKSGDIEGSAELVRSFKEIAEAVKSHPGVQVSNNSVTEGECFSVNGVTLTDHSNAPFRGGPFLKIKGYDGFLVLHNYDERIDGSTEWVSSSSIEKSDIKTTLQAMSQKLG